MPMEIVRQDITKMKVDAIVNAANQGLKKGGGVCGAIFTAAGEAILEAACDHIGQCEVGGAVITPGYGLPAKWIIHTVGPVWQGGEQHEADKLYACYTNSMNLAIEHDCASIAFPLIASGVYSMTIMWIHIEGPGI